MNMLYFSQGLRPRGPAGLPPRAWSWLGFVGFASSAVGGCAARLYRTTGSAHRHSGVRGLSMLIGATVMFSGALTAGESYKVDTIKIGRAHV